MTAAQPSLFIPHGGGPCFFMPDPRGTWTEMGDYLRALPATLPEPPSAILVISGHWEAPAFAFTGAASHPGLIFDYYGFPPETPAGRTIDVARFAGRGGLSFSGSLDGAALELTVTALACSDGMSDRSYPFTATLKLGDELRSGCGWSERQPFTGPANP